MFKTINLHAEIADNHELHITLPSDVPTGPADLVVVISCAEQPAIRTLGELAVSEFIGMWRDRREASEELARQLRSEAWKRSA